MNLNEEKLKANPLKSGTIQCCLLSLYLFSVVPEVTAREMRQLKEIKGIHTGKEEFKVLLFVDDMIACISYPKNPTRNSYSL